jgi:hypothetical protein
MKIRKQAERCWSGTSSPPARCDYSRERERPGHSVLHVHGNNLNLVKARVRSEHDGATWRAEDGVLTPAGGNAGTRAVRGRFRSTTERGAQGTAAANPAGFRPTPDRGSPTPAGWARLRSEAPVTRRPEKVDFGAMKESSTWLSWAHDPQGTTRAETSTPQQAQTSRWTAIHQGYSVGRVLSIRRNTFTRPRTPRPDQ